jgi:crotonobetainyl-CoA:carnitine CoA-transferase CaiB-like acyl-CoA transferase
MLLSGTWVIDATNRVGWLAGRVLADLGAEVIKVDPPNTDRSGPEWRAFNVNKRVLDIDLAQPDNRSVLDKLLSRADICVVTPGADDPNKIDPYELRERHPHLVVVVITPFGLTGPRQDWRASDIELMAAGGAMSLAGDPDGVPLRVTEPQSYSWAGAQAAIGALVALFRRETSGKGALVDASAQASVVMAAAHAPAFYDLLGVIPQRAGAFITGRSISGARFRVFWPCLDGHINFIFYGGVAGKRTNEQLVVWMQERGEDLGALAGIDWNCFDVVRATQAEVDAIEAPVLRFFSNITKHEFLTEAHRREMLGYPVSTVADLASDPQLEEREFFADVDGIDGVTQRHCGSFSIIDGKRSPLRYPAGTRFVMEREKS